MNPVSNPAGSYAIRAAMEATAVVGHPLRPRSLDAVTTNTLRAHALAHSSTRTSRAVEYTRRAISSWRDLAGLNSPATLDNRRNVALETEFGVSGRIAVEACRSHSVCVFANEVSIRRRPRRTRCPAAAALADRWHGRKSHRLRAAIPATGNVVNLIGRHAN
jgi:hypothetical protein